MSLHIMVASATVTELAPLTHMHERPLDCCPPRADQPALRSSKLAPRVTGSRADRRISHVPRPCPHHFLRRPSGVSNPLADGRIPAGRSTHCARHSVTARIAPLFRSSHNNSPLFI